MELTKNDVEYLDSVGFKRSGLANNPGENRIFIKRNGDNPLVLNIRCTTPVGGIVNKDGRILGKPCIGIIYQTLTDDKTRPKSETPLFLGNVDSFEDLKIVMKQTGVI
jgi:hypothetical protein